MPQNWELSMNQDVSTRLFEASLLIIEDKVDEAISELQKLIEEDNLCYEAYSLKVISLLTLGREEDALSTINQYLNLCTDNIDAWNQKGEILLNLKQAKEAGLIFKEALALNPNFIQSLSGLGKSLIAQKEYSEALVFVEKAISKRFNSADLWMLKSSIYWALQNNEMALICVEAAIQNKHGAAKRVKAATKSIENKHKEWEDYISKISSTDKFVRIVRMIQIQNELDKKYEVEIGLNDFEDRDIFNFSLEELYLMKCEILIKMNKKNEALESLCEVSRLNPKNTKSWFAQGNLCRELGSFEEAAHKYEMILELEPQNKLALYGKSLSLYKAKLLKEAFESFEILVSMYQDDEQLWMQYGFIALDFGTQNNKKSIIYRSSYAFLQAGKLNQNNIEAWLYAAIAYKRSDSVYDAKSCLNRAIEIDIKFVKARIEDDILFQPLKDLESEFPHHLEDLESRKAKGKNVFEDFFKRFF